ncbi:MAG: hypothetical protein ACRDO0_04525 [Nocardioidaceae bacterium]
MVRHVREDVGLRAAHLAEAGRLLWPAPARFVVQPSAPRTMSPGSPGSPGSPVSEFVLVPNAAQPRLLVPGRPRAVAAAAVRRYTSTSSRTARARLQVLSMLLATGFGQRLLRDRACVYADSTTDAPLDTIETYLRDVLGADVQVSMHIGPARANRKPILQVLDPGGETVAFVKVGINDLTRRLVRAEAASLVFLAGARLRTLEVPPLLHHGRWQDNEVLVLGVLPTWRRTPAREPVLRRAMLELAQVNGLTSMSQPLARSQYWQRLGRDVAALADDEARRSLGRVLHDLAPVAAATAVPLGSWHGDWTPWNMAARGQRLMVWDWERFTSGVPVGYDAVHYDLQHAVTRGGAAPEAAVHDTWSRSARLLEPFGIGPEQAPLVVASYLVEIAVRYLQDGQAGAGARLGHLGQWLLPALVHHAHTMCTTSP